MFINDYEYIARYCAGEKIMFDSLSNGNDDIIVKVTQTGFTDPSGVQGIIVLTSNDGRSLSMSSFSGEVANYVSKFMDGDRTSTPSIYKMISELADRHSIFLKEVEIYERNSVLRANLYFKCRDDDYTLHNYRASDSIALATFYDAPIRISRSLFDKLSSQVYKTKR